MHKTARMTLFMFSLFHLFPSKYNNGSGFLFYIYLFIYLSKVYPCWNETRAFSSEQQNVLVSTDSEF